MVRVRIASHYSVEAIEDIELTDLALTDVFKEQLDWMNSENMEIIKVVGHDHDNFNMISIAYSADFTEEQLTFYRLRWPEQQF